MKVNRFFKIIETEKQLISEIERASLVATAEEALKLYELLHGKLELLVKHLTDEKSKKTLPYQ